jgi:RimJ/RimL family protein N-acetyltransferase
MVPDGYTEAMANEFIRSSEERRLAGISLDCAIVDAAEEGSLLGSVGIVSVDPRHSRAELGYWTAPWARRRGVAARGLRLLSKWTFATLDVARLELMPFTENLVSQAVAERAGYTREGVLRSFYRSKRNQVDVVMYSLLPNEITEEDTRQPAASQ